MKVKIYLVLTAALGLLLFIVPGIKLAVTLRSAGMAIILGILVIVLCVTGVMAWVQQDEQV